MRGASRIVLLGVEKLQQQLSKPSEKKPQKPRKSSEKRVESVVSPDLNPLKSTVEIDQACLLLGINRPDWNSGYQMGSIPRIGTTQYPIGVLVPHYCNYLRQRIAELKEKPKNAGFVEENAAKTRIALAKAEKLEAENMRQSGALIHHEELMKRLGGKFIAVRNKLLAVASRAAPIVAVETDAEMIAKIISDLIEETLTELSLDGLESENETSDGPDNSGIIQSPETATET